MDLSEKREIHEFVEFCLFLIVEILIAVHIPKKPGHQFRLSRFTCFSMKIANI